MNLATDRSEDFEINCFKAGHRCEASVTMLKEKMKILKVSNSADVVEANLVEDLDENLVNIRGNETESDNDELEFFERFMYCA